MATREFLAEVPIENLSPSPINVRRDVGDVSELADSIREQGILEPLVVRPKEDGHYEVIIGSRRLAASKTIGLPSLPVMVQTISDADAIIRSLVENIQRGDLPLEDRVAAYSHLQAMDPERFSTRGLARLTGRAHQKIVQDFEAHETMVQLQPRGIRVASSLPPSAPDRQSGEAMPEYHAVVLQQAMMAVHGLIPAEKIDETRAELARAIAPLERDRAKRVLDNFKMYPDRPVSELAHMALATVERSVILPASTARQLEEYIDREGEGNWNSAITRLIERSPLTGQSGQTDSENGEEEILFNSQLGTEMFSESDVRDMADSLQEQNRVLREQYRPLNLPEEPASVQTTNKLIWNLTHYAPSPDFYTIGYSGRDIRQFVEILKAAGVSSVVDVRHAPISQYKPDFNKASLKGHLETEGIRYSHRGDWGVPHAIRERAVGGGSRESIWEWYDQNVAPTVGTGGVEAFKASGQMVAFMCSEVDPTACHRHRLFLAIEATGFRGFDL